MHSPSLDNSHPLAHVGSSVSMASHSQPVELKVPLGHSRSLALTHMHPAFNSAPSGHMTSAVPVHRAEYGVRVDPWGQVGGSLSVQLQLLVLTSNPGLQNGIILPSQAQIPWPFTMGSYPSGQTASRLVLHLHLLLSNTVSLGHEGSLQIYSGKSVNISLSKVMYKCTEEMLRYVTSHTP